MDFGGDFERVNFFYFFKNKFILLVVLLAGSKFIPS